MNPIPGAEPDDNAANPNPFRGRRRRPEIRAFRCGGAPEDYPVSEDVGKVGNADENAVERNGKQSRKRQSYPRRLTARRTAKAETPVHGNWGTSHSSLVHWSILRR
jgi:hypothetical protein